jgi:hypothetical protein
VLRTTDVGEAMHGLRDDRAVMWLATVGDKAAASTAMYLRSLRHPRQDRTLPIGYWAHLFVLPEYRKLMLYPQLVFTMRKAMSELGVEAILTAMRRPQVTEGHLKLGFKVVCSWPVLVKPLRPFALLAKHKGIRAAGLAAPVGDGLWRVLQSMRSGAQATGLTIEARNASDVRQEPEVLDELSRVLSDTAGQRIATDWTPGLLRDRLGGGVDGERYHVLFARRGGTLAGVAICRMATRGNDIRTGVILELAVPSQEPNALRALARACESALVADGAEAMLWLDGAGRATSDTLRNSGYRVAADETYRLIAFTTENAERLMDPDADAWRFTFLDHDAF